MYVLFKRKYGFTDYQIAQLRFFFLTVFSEISKIIIIGLFFMDNIPLYIWGLFVLFTVHTSTGGFHCKTYLGCLSVSVLYMILSIRILPLISLGTLTMMFTILVSCIVAYKIGPVISPIHLHLSNKRIIGLKHRLLIFNFLYLIALYIIPENPFITAGYWIIILNTLQLVAAKILYKEMH